MERKVSDEVEVYLKEQYDLLVPNAAESSPEIAELVNRMGANPRDCMIFWDLMKQVAGRYGNDQSVINQLAEIHEPVCSGHPLCEDLLVNYSG